MNLFYEKYQLYQRGPQLAVTFALPYPYNRQQWFSKWGPLTHIIGIIWTLLGNQICWLYLRPAELETQEDAAQLSVLTSPPNILEEEMATHSSILAWEIPWTEEPGGLQSTGSQRVGHDWVCVLTHQGILMQAYVWEPLLFANRVGLNMVQTVESPGELYKEIPVPGPHHWAF